MTRSKEASSQAAWALLMEGVTKARLEAHRLQHLLGRASVLVESSEHKELLYQLAGDIIGGVPDRLNQLLLTLDRTGYALSKMGQEFLAPRLPLGEKTLVDESIEPAFGRAQTRHSARLVAHRYLRSLEVD